MKVFLTDGKKVSIYSLPQKIEDSFFITYKAESGLEDSIIITANEEKWMITSNPETSFYSDGKLVESAFLENNSIFQVQFSDMKDKFRLYVFDTPIPNVDFDISNKYEITVGRDQNSVISYQDPNIANSAFHIIKQAGTWVFEVTGPNQEVYINYSRADKAILNMGDIIFLHGIKIIWFDSFIRINAPKNPLTTSLQKLTPIDNHDNQYTEETDTEKASVLYEDNQVFFHTPRLKETLTDQTISIQLPPHKQESNRAPVILQMGGTMMMGLSASISGVIAIFSIIKGQATILSSITEIAVCICMLLGSIFFPVLLDRFQKRQDKKYEKKRQKKYREYLDKKVEEINKIMAKEKQILIDNNLSIKEIQNAIINRSNRIWSREITDNDFLSMRLGTGNLKSNLQIKAHLDDFSLEDDDLKQLVTDIVNQKLILENVPITASLTEDRILPVIINPELPNRQQYVDALLLQLFTYYSGVDLKIVIITSEENREKWEYLKYLPHCSSNDQTEHYFAANEDEMKQLTAYLEKVRQDRIKYYSKEANEDENAVENIHTDDDPKTKYKDFDTYYLIITDNFITAKRYEFIEKIVNSEVNLGFSILMFEDTMKNLPSKCNRFVDIETNISGIFSKDLSEEKQRTFTAEFQTDNNNEQYARILGNVPVIGENMSSSLPTSLNFLEMYKVGKIEQLNIPNRWINSNPNLSLQAPIGVHEDGKLFELDLHEKAYGPHGLIAGATGSGKSEFIITYILSMAINYHPYDVQFVLIDYKGGGLAGAFYNKDADIVLPHLAGVITNLDTAEMNRTLVSIKSELKRRQRIFNDARDALNESTIDIYKYQKFFREGKVQEPVSHLFIISDEFAELKSQQPDFMDELVSIARIGRSLGVHLILATQKPSGVVDDQIWSNSRFKVSLKVQTEEDSMELLKRPDAASIKETGRFYLQVGFNEVFELGQAAWAGAKYNPMDRILKVYEDDITFIDDVGNVLKKTNNALKSETQNDYGDQLTNIVKILDHIADRNDIRVRSLWLPSLPSHIYLSELMKKYHYQSESYNFDILIGEYDDPENQFQDKLTINLMNSGNILIYGLSGSGKENLITTIIYSCCLFHSTSEVNFYILDFGAEVLGNFQKFPQVGDVVTAVEKEKIMNQFAKIEREINRRKDLFREYGGSYESYIKQSGKQLPLIITVLNNYESFVENYLDLDEKLTSELRECAKYGIIFISTVVATNAMRPSITQLYATKIMLQIGDPYEYVYQLDAKNNLMPAKYFGRGLIKLAKGTFEFQTAYIFEEEQINEALKTTAQKLEEHGMVKAPAIPNIPKEVTYETVLGDITDIDTVPIGYNIDTAEMYHFNFIENRISFICGNQINTEPQFLLDLVKVINTIPSVKLRIIDLAGNMSECGIDECYNGEFTNVIHSILSAEDDTKQKIIYLITGIGYIYDRVLDEGIQELFNILDGSLKLPNSYFILADNFVSMRKLEKEMWFQMAPKDSGIWIGDNFSSQNMIQPNEFRSYDSNESFLGLAFPVHNKEYVVIKSIGSKEMRGW